MNHDGFSPFSSHGVPTLLTRGPPTADTLCGPCYIESENRGAEYGLNQNRRETLWTSTPLVIIWNVTAEKPMMIFLQNHNS
jgi:hypothetical protein